MKSFNVRNKRLFFNFFLSYTIMLIIPIILISVMVYGRLLGTLEQEAIKSNITVIEQARDTLDMNLRQLDELAFQLSNHPSVYDFISSKEPDMVDVNMKIGSAIRALNISSVNVIKSFGDTVGIYSAKNDVFISHSTKYEPDLFYSSFLKNNSIVFTTWIDKIKNISIRECWPSLEIANGSRPNQKYITYLHPLAQYGIKSDAVFFALLDEEKIWAFFGNNDLNRKSYRVIVDGNNQIVTAAPGSIGPIPVDYAAILKPNQSHTFFENKGQKYIAIFTSSRVIPWNYVTILPVKVLMEKISFLYFLFSIVILICTILGITLSYIFSARNYKPIQNIMELIYVNKKEAGDQDSEYETIMSTLSGMFAQNRLLENQLHKQRPILKVHFFLRLLKNNTIDTKEAEELLELYDLKFPHPSFVVVIVNMDDFSSFAGKDGGTGKSLARFVISNIGEETINTKWISHAIEIEEDKVAFLINLDTSAKAENEYTMDNLLKSLQDYLGSKFHIYVSIGAGRMYPSLSLVHRSYTEAMSALNYSLIRGKNIITYFEQKKGYSNNIYYPQEVENQLINYIKLGDFPGVEQLLTEIHEENIVKRRLSPRMVNCLLNDVMSTSLKIIDEIHLDFMDVFDEEANILQNINSLDDIENIFMEIKEVFRELCRFILEKKESGNVYLRDEILKYICERYPDKDLSLVKAAGRFNISPPYLSTFFKQQTGYNFSDYLNRFRINQAKALLSRQEVSIQEIADLIGYNSANSFIRIFKKYESITPGQYKDSVINRGMNGHT